MREAGGRAQGKDCGGKRRKERQAALEAQKPQAKVEEQKRLEAEAACKAEEEKERQAVLEAQKAQAKVEEQKRLEAEAARKAEEEKERQAALEAQKAQAQVEGPPLCRSRNPALIRSRVRNSEDHFDSLAFL